MTSSDWISLIVHFYTFGLIVPFAAFTVYRVLRTGSIWGDLIAESYDEKGNRRMTAHETKVRDAYLRQFVQ